MTPQSIYATLKLKEAMRSACVALDRVDDDLGTDVDAADIITWLIAEIYSLRADLDALVARKAVQP